MQKQQRAYAHMALVVLFWATVATAFKISLRYVNPIQLLLYGSLTAALTLYIVLLLQKKRYLLRAYGKSEVAFAALLGFINPFVFYLVLFNAYNLLPAQVAMVINYTWPITLTLLSIPFLRQPIGLYNVTAIVISFFGVVIISTRGQFLSFANLSPLGIGLALLSTVIWATFWILNLKDTHDEVVKLFLSFSFGFIYTAISLPFLSRYILPDWKGIISLVYVGLFEMGLTFVIWLRALRLSRTTAQVSNLIFLIPFLSLVIIHLVLGERIYISSLLGLIFIVAGIILQQKYSAEADKKSPGG